MNSELDTDFITREISKRSEDYPQIKATRVRTTSGHNTIILVVGQQMITFSGNKNDMGDHYEMMAREASAVLDDIAFNPCTLPKE